jgi:hypothetical protein
MGSLILKKIRICIISARVQLHIDTHPAYKYGCAIVLPALLHQPVSGGSNCPGDHAASALNNQGISVAGL